VKRKLLENIGIFWDGKVDLKILPAGSVKNALHIFKKNIASIAWNCISALERNPTTLPQTETILKGQSVSGISIDDLMQVKRYGDAAKKLIEIIDDENFFLDKNTVCTLHNIIGKEEALTWGKFRDSLVIIRDIHQYTPPDSGLLDSISGKGFSFLQNEIKSPQERSVATFLFMARNQFFYDVNKRTASLMMNGILMKEGICPIAIMNKDSEEFHTKLRAFYNTGDATDMMRLFERSVKEMYLPQKQAVDRGRER
jgi:Fic family protein